MRYSIHLLLQSSAIAISIAGAAVVAAPTTASAQFAISVTVPIAPPALPVYVQPPLPAPGYLWTPGYWAWGGEDYYWVPGTWVLPPRVGLLWTPGYWGWNNGVYLFNTGYWGRTVGYYGGISYGFGYTGNGYAGGYWNNGALFYNRSVNSFGNTNITNVYNKTVVVNNTTINNVSYNGGAGGVVAKPTPAQLAVAQQPHVAPTPRQIQHQTAAAQAPELHFKANQGKPSIAATPQPGALHAPGIVPAVAAAPKPAGEVAPQPKPIAPMAPPVVHAPAAPAPVVHAPAAPAPVVHAPAAPAPVVHAPAAPAAVVHAPVAPAPVVHAPAAQAPVFHPPAAQFHRPPPPRMPVMNAPPPQRRAPPPNCKPPNCH